MTILELKDKMKEAMRAKDSVALTTIRNMITACTNEAINLGRGPQGELTSEETVAVLRRESKRAKDAIQQFTDGGRSDLADENSAELVVIESFLPKLMTLEQIVPVVAEIATETGLDASKIGQLIGAVNKKLAGQADGADIKHAVEQFFTGK